MECHLEQYTGIEDARECREIPVDDALLIHWDLSTHPAYALRAMRGSLEMTVSNTHLTNPCKKPYKKTHNRMNT